MRKVIITDEFTGGDIRDNYFSMLFPYLMEIFFFPNTKIENLTEKAERLRGIFQRAHMFEPAEEDRCKKIRNILEEYFIASLRERDLERIKELEIKSFSLDVDGNYLITVNSHPGEKPITDPFSLLNYIHKNLTSKNYGCYNDEYEYGHSQISEIVIDDIKKLKEMLKNVFN